MEMHSISGSSIRLQGIGSVSLLLSTGETQVLPDVYYGRPGWLHQQPTLTGYLVGSRSSFPPESQGWFLLEFDDHSCVVATASGGRDNLYFLDICPTSF